MTLKCGHDESNLRQRLRSDGYVRNRCRECTRQRDANRSTAIKRATAPPPAVFLSPPPNSDWHKDSACREPEARDLFYPERGESPNAAKMICGDCPVRVECLSWALETREAHGIWGGKTPQERLSIQRNARKARRDAA